MLRLGLQRKCGVSDSNLAETPHHVRRANTLAGWCVFTRYTGCFFDTSAVLISQCCPRSAIEGTRYPINFGNYKQPAPGVR